MAAKAKEAKRVKKSDAAKIAYYLMAADGNVTKPEIKSFSQIAKELGVTEKNEWKDAEDVVEGILKKNSEPDKIYNKIRANINELIGGEDYCAGWSDINPYLLIWDMMTLSIADNDYSGNEEKLIKYVAGKLGIEGAILSEMDNAIRALYAVTAEEKWLKESGRDEEDIKAILSELKKRKKTIKNSVTLFFDNME